MFLLHAIFYYNGFVLYLATYNGGGMIYM